MPDGITLQRAQNIVYDRSFIHYERSVFEIRFLYELLLAFSPLFASYRVMGLGRRELHNGW